MPDCIFCKIASGQFESDVVYEDDDIIAFNDINPEAPIHILLIPKSHIESLKDAGEGEAALLGKIQLVAKELAKDRGIESGYRLVLNVGPEAGQTVDHIHYHLLGGRRLTWPPG